MNPSCTSQVLRFTDWRNEWKPWSETIRIGVVCVDARHHFADEVVALAVDALDRVAVLRRQRLVVHRVRRIDQPPHHVLHAIGRFDDADQQVPLLGVDPLEDHLRAVVERAVEIVHEDLLVDAVFVERPGRFRPAERAVRAEALVDVGRERRRRRHRRRRVVGPPVHRRDVQLQLRSGADQIQLRHAVDADQQVDVEVEVDPLAPLVLGEVDRAVADGDGRRLRRPCSSGS